MILCRVKLCENDIKIFFYFVNAFCLIKLLKLFYAVLILFVKKYPMNITDFHYDFNPLIYVIFEIDIRILLRIITFVINETRIDIRARNFRSISIRTTCAILISRISACKSILFDFRGNTSQG